MATNYAPYQDENPDDPPPAAQSQSNFAQDDWAAEDGEGEMRSSRTGGGGGGGFGNGMGADERAVDPYNTSLPMRIEIEACLAYLGLPPAGGAVLLMMEHKNDYVRFHAWQSSLIFTVIFVCHAIMGQCDGQTLTANSTRSCTSSSPLPKFSA